jgi:hypothetical protein
VFNYHVESFDLGEVALKHTHNECTSGDSIHAHVARRPPRGDKVLRNLAVGLLALAAVLLIGPARARAGMTDGLIGYWPFDGTDGFEALLGARNVRVSGDAGFGNDAFGQSVGGQRDCIQFATRAAKNGKSLSIPHTASAVVYWRLK